MSNERNLSLLLLIFKFVFSCADVSLKSWLSAEVLGVWSGGKKLDAEARRAAEEDFFLRDPRSFLRGSASSFSCPHSNHLPLRFCHEQ